jgi:hypothetical protein
VAPRDSEPASRSAPRDRRDSFPHCRPRAVANRAVVPGHPRPLAVSRASPPARGARIAGLRFERARPIHPGRTVPKLATYRALHQETLNTTVILPPPNGIANRKSQISNLTSAPSNPKRERGRALHRHRNSSHSDCPS